MFVVNTFVFTQLLLHAIAIPVENIGEEKVHFGDSPDEDYPSLVSLGDESDHFCGATLITKDHLLTAAHCFRNATKVYRIVIGSRHRFKPEGPDSQVMTFGQEAWTLNPYVNDKHTRGYEGEKNNNIFDSAVITLPTSVTLSENVQTIRLAKEVYKNNLRVVGWGRMNCKGKYPWYYLYAKGSLAGKFQCKWMYKSPPHESQICAKFTNEKGQPSGSDVGDSGGPLYATAGDDKDVQIGIVSTGIPNNPDTPEECTNPAIPMRFAKVSEAETFIKSIAKDAVFV